MMSSNEWPLVFFTMLSQISVGILIGMLILWITIRNMETETAESLKRILLLTAMGSMGVALLLSFLHLSMPQHAVYAMSNVRTSWLSREILLASLFLLTLILCYTSARYSLPHRNLFNQLFLASLIVGLVFMWAIPKVYMIPTVPLWDTPSTPIAFFNTALMLGGGVALVVTAMLASGKSTLPGIAQMQSVLFFMITAAVFIGLLNMFLLQPDIGAVTGNLPTSVVSGNWQTLRIFFLLAGYSALAYWIAYQLPHPGGASSIMIYIAVACLFISELAGRYLFYASYFRVGV